MSKPSFTIPADKIKTGDTIEVKWNSEKSLLGSSLQIMRDGKQVYYSRAHGNPPIKLIITDKGDPSVGITEQCWQIETPFFSNWKQDYENVVLELFREQMRSAYCDFCEGRCVVEYDFELEGYNEP